MPILPTRRPLLSFDKVMAVLCFQFSFASTLLSGVGLAQQDSTACEFQDGRTNSLQFVGSLFENDVEGWLILGDARGEQVTPDFTPTDGNPGGHIHATDDVAGGVWYWQAPPKFLGDVSTGYGQTLSFDLRQSDTSSQFDDDDVVLAGENLSLVFDTPNNPGTSWTTYCVPLQETGWKKQGTDQVPSQSEFQSVLASLTELLIRGEFRTGSDVGGLDNVIFVRPEPAAEGPGRLTVVTAPTDGDPALIAPAIELILDASNSMWGQIGGQAKIEIAKDVMTQVIDILPDGTQVALRLYGHRRSFREEGACQDTELVVPLGPLDAERLKEVVQGISPRGTTPIAYSIRQVVHDLAGVPGNQRIVVLTDGIEECDGDIEGAISELRQQGLNVDMWFVAFAFTEEAIRRQLDAVAALPGVRVVDAHDAAELLEQVSQAVSFEVLDTLGEQVATGTVGGDAVEVAEGAYTVVVQLLEGVITIPDVAITASQSTMVELPQSR